MRENIIQFLKTWLSPGMIRLISGKKGVKWSGDYNSWEKAQRASTGYDSEIILNRVRDSLLKVKNGKAMYERDSVLFEKIEYSWPLLAFLMLVAVKSKGKLNVIDFGGSLGSTYFQNRKFLSALSMIQWNIVEQRHFVEVGKKYFENDILKFFYDIEGCLKQASPDTILFSSVIQYLETPYELLEKVKALNFEYILFDRTPFILEGKDRLTIQSVPPEIYRASYPCWFFDKKKFYAFFKDKYSVIATFGSMDKANIPSTFEGCILRKK